jgi:glutathione S-transferase
MTLKLYFIPGRSWLPRWLLGELDEPFDLILLDRAKNEHKQPAFLAINSLGKLPALEVDGRVMTETAAICLFLADRRGDMGLAPALDDPGRGRYLTLMVHASAALEPAIEDIILKRRSDPKMVGWGVAEDEFAFVEGHLGEGPYLFGSRFTAADVMIGGVLIWTKLLGVALPPRLDAYATRLMARPVLARLFEESAPPA